MFQRVSHGTEDIGNHVDDNDQCANHHDAGGNRRIVLLADRVDQPASQSGPAEHHLGDHRQGEHGGKLQAEARDHRRQGVVQYMAQ